MSQSQLPQPPQPPAEERTRHPFLQWRGLHVDMEVLRLFASFWVSIVIAIGCFGIILAPTNNTTTQAAVAILASLATGWITWMVREQNQE